MSIERESGIIRFNCDGPCHKNYEWDDNDDFGDAWRSAKAHGWINHHGREGWQHYCATCKKGFGE